MNRFLLAFILVAAPMLGNAQNTMVDDIIDDHILPRFQTLADASAQLALTAEQDCAPASMALQSDYLQAFDAWIGVSHLRFGPTEVDNRAFALAFWPDSRGATPRALTTLLTEEDPAIRSPEEFAQVSIAARGFYALELLLFDEALAVFGEPADHCALVQSIATDISHTSNAILKDWMAGFAAEMHSPNPDGFYRSEEEALRELLKALATGLQFTSETRLGRPLGTFERPRPNRAESWRSGRSARHVDLSLAALSDLARRLSSDDPALSQRLGTSFERTQALLSELEDPVFAGVAAPQSRFKIEAIQQSIDIIRALVQQELGPSLGVASGFNALDGD